MKSEFNIFFDAPKTFEIQNIKPLSGLVGLYFIFSPDNEIQYPFRKSKLLYPPHQPHIFYSNPASYLWRKNRYMINSQKQAAMFARVDEWKKSGKTMREFATGIGLSAINPDRVWNPVRVFAKNCP